MASRPVVIDVLRFLWQCDEHEFPHPRHRLRLSLAVLLLTYLGVRPGEFLESSASRGGNGGVLYGDLSIFVVPDPTASDKRSTARFAVLVRLRNRKNNRLKQYNNVYLPLVEGVDRRELCPVTQILALAMADHAIEQVECPDDLERVRYRDGQAVRRLHIRATYEQVPLLRAMDRDRTISKTNILSTDSLRTQLTTLGQRAQYNDPMVAYNFRRMHGNMLDSNVTSARRRKNFGH